MLKTTQSLMVFVDKCSKLGYNNNSSLEVMNFQKTLNEGGVWFETSVDNEIVGISGLHKFKDGHRALYRGCQLHSIPGGLSKNHMNCWMFYYHLPIVIDAVGDDPIYITTNTDNDASGKMLRLNKLYKILAKKGIVDLISTEQVRGVQQNIWLLNNNVYTTLRGD